MKPKKALLIQFLTDCNALLLHGIKDTLEALPPQEVQQKKDTYTDKFYKTAQVLRPINEAQDKIAELIELLKDE